MLFRSILALTRDWARSQQLPHVYDSIGICHVVLPQQGHIRPGMFCVGGDSHSPTGGAFRSEEHTSELQPLMRIPYAVFCLKKQNILTSILSHCLPTTLNAQQHQV